MGYEKKIRTVRPKPEVLLSKYYVSPNGCWNWTGRLDRAGYGIISRWFEGKSHDFKAHRAVYEALRGQIPEGLGIDHLCRNRKCVNPEHLEPVSARVNTMRGNTVTRENAERTHCIHGHEFTKKNTGRSPGSPNNRYCKRCNSLRSEANKKRRIESARSMLPAGPTSQ